MIAYWLYFWKDKNRCVLLLSIVHVAVALPLYSTISQVTLFTSDASDFIRHVDKVYYYGNAFVFVHNVLICARLRVFTVLYSARIHMSMSCMCICTLCEHVYVREGLCLIWCTHVFVCVCVGLYACMPMYVHVYTYLYACAYVYNTIIWCMYFIYLYISVWTFI